ncbi:MAG: ABC transporter ATP-binding protein [Alphaproteobacteria bacterium]|nr:ABC transporter ATP-binding protein [Alphaproteobacteria bacterium]
MISIQNVSKSFGGIRAVDDCSFDVAKGSITGLIGPNGAGKTTLFNIVAGVFAPTSGQVLLEGRDITGKKPHELFALGLVRTFQIAQEYSEMTVLENLCVVPPGQSGESLFTACFSWNKVKGEEVGVRKRAEEVLAFLRLSDLRYEKAGNLSGGQKKLLELGRTMMIEAKIVLLDELGAGVNRTLLATLATDIERLNREHGYTFCVIEHDMDLIARLCDPIIVMAEGSVLTTGTMAEIRANDQVIEAYLGHSDKKQAARR